MARDHERILREYIRDWAKTAQPGEEPHDYITETADSYITYHSTTIEIMEEGNLWSDEPDMEPRDRSPMAAMEAVAFEWCEQQMWEEWRDIENERSDGSLFWCEAHGEWHEEGEGVYCDDCGDITCCDEIVQKDDGETSYCKSCALDHEDEEENTSDE